MSISDRLITISEPAITFDSIATPIFTSMSTLPQTYSPPVTSVTITLNTLPPKTTDVAFETTALTYVPLKSNVACHTLGMVYDTGIEFSMDSAKSDDQDRKSVV